ncbi:MAG: zinc ribbon domain-containing protein [Nitrosarchaeum sp.]|nr:zinc ribbon domain-containing protein [Nitrosarchaeum sp.]
MNFESELKKGKLIIPECNHCNKIVWPPSEFCNQCFNEVSWRTGSSKGKIIEFSKQNDNYFGLIEIENSIRVLGKISSGIPNLGQHVKIEKCGIKDGSYYFEFLLI